jgi:hypothetical protein
MKYNNVCCFVRSKSIIHIQHFTGSFVIGDKTCSVFFPKTKCNPFEYKKCLLNSGNLFNPLKTKRICFI